MSDEPDRTALTMPTVLMLSLMMLHQMLLLMHAETQHETSGIRYLIKVVKQKLLRPTSKGIFQNSIKITLELPLRMATKSPTFSTNLPQQWIT